MRISSLLIILLVSLRLSAQTLGGNTVFNFLKLPATPQLTALGGVNVSHISNDIGLAFNNPALLKPAMHTQMNAVFNSIYGISSYTLALGYHHQHLNTTFSWGLNYLSYGNITETDAAGNEFGRFRATDWVMQVSASRSYLNKWNYGATLKFINSDYGKYNSNGIAIDFGLLYHDTAKLFSASLVAKNMGSQLKKYDGTDPDDLPFDLQIGLSKRLENSPFGFSLTAHHLHRFDIQYNDAEFNDQNGFTNSSDKKFSFDKLFRHIVAGVNIYLGDNVEIAAGYNYLRRKELTIGGAGNGLTGFSLGASLVMKKLQIRYARAQYQNNTAYNQLGLNIKLNEYFGLGKFGQRVGW